MEQINRESRLEIAIERLEQVQVVLEELGRDEDVWECYRLRCNLQLNLEASKRAAARVAA